VINLLNPGYCWVKVSEGFEGVIEHDRSEMKDLLSLLFVQISFMGSGADEFYIVFDHGQQLLYVDEDRKIHVEFRHKKGLDKFVSALTKLDYLPKELEKKGP